MASDAYWDIACKAKDLRDTIHFHDMCWEYYNEHKGELGVEYVCYWPDIRACSIKLIRIGRKMKAMREQNA